MGNLKGVDNLKKLLKKFRKDSDKVVQKALEHVADLIVLDAKTNVPVRQGKLKESIKKESIELGVKIGTDVWSAPYQEFGTRGGGLSIPKGQEEYAMTFIGEVPGNTPPRPFLFPALFKNQDKIIPFIEEELEKALKDIK